MGTRRSKHNRGRKPLYKEHRDNLLNQSCLRCGGTCFPGSRLCKDCYTAGSSFISSDAAKALNAEAVNELSEDASFALFCQLRWRDTAGEPVCPACDSGNVHASSRRRTWDCRECDHTFSATSRTPFARHKVGFRAILLSIIATNSSADLTAAERAIMCGTTTKSAVVTAQRIRLHENWMREENFQIGVSRYIGGGFYSTRTWWTEGEKAALRRFVTEGFSPEKSAVALGRSPTSIKHYAKDLGVPLKGAWSFYKYKPRANDPKVIDLCYPYIMKRRDEHADVLAVNNIVPKTLPPNMRADICQEIMLAMLEGKLTLDELKAKQGKARWFVSQFYKNNFEDSGHAMSLTGVNDDGDEYDAIAARVSYDEYRADQMRERRSAWESIDNRFHPPTQTDDVYHHQVRNEQRRWHVEDKTLLDYGEAEEELDRLDPKKMRHLKRFSDMHTVQRLRERYGITYSTAVHSELKGAVIEGRVRVTETIDERTFVGWVRCQGRNVRLVFDPETREFITVLPPQDDGLTWLQRERLRASGELAA